MTCQLCSQLEHQYSLLLAGEEPTVRHSALDLLIDRVKDRGLVILADKAAAALKVHRAQRRGPNIKFKKVAKMVNAPKMGMLVSQAMRGKSLKFDRLDEDVNSLYSEISPSAHHGSQRSNTYNVSPQAVHESGSLVTGKGREVEASRVASSSDWSMSR